MFYVTCMGEQSVDVTCVGYVLPFRMVVRAKEVCHDLTQWLPPSVSSASLVTSLDPLSGEVTSDVQ